MLNTVQPLLSTGAKIAEIIIEEPTSDDPLQDCFDAYPLTPISTPMESDDEGKNDTMDGIKPQSLKTVKSTGTVKSIRRSTSKLSNRSKSNLSTRTVTSPIKYSLHPPKTPARSDTSADGSP